MRINRNVREAIIEKIQNSTTITVEEVMDILNTRIEKDDIARLVANEKKRVARRTIASVRDKNKVRSYYAMCDPAHTFVNVDKCVVYEKLAMAEKQLKTKRDGINRSLGKGTRMKRSLEKCVAKSGMQSEEATALATKLYAMADELQSLIGMQLAA